jgi:2-keto-4-pentenoate hydratase/2-oxohepta-3-ene-1,7-dioic acid hydratase in catechol pathway
MTLDLSSATADGLRKGALTTQGALAATFRLAGAELDGGPAVVVDTGSGAYRLADLLPAAVTAPDHVHELLADWSRWLPVLSAVAERAPSLGATPVLPERWGLPVCPSKLVCIGTNYHDHLREMGTARAPEYPYAFLKPVSTGLVASGAEVRLPDGPAMVDWEAELAVVIGRPLHEAHGASVLDAVAGYTIINDLSARDWIRGKPEVGIDWVMMKGYDGFSPIGPWFTPAQLVPDPQALGIRCWVNGELRQDSNTSEMVFGVRAILEHLSGIMTLLPGDVVATGTPAGVGFGREPQQFLHAGDTVAVEIDGLGRLETRMVPTTTGGPTT